MATEKKDTDPGSECQSSRMPDCYCDVLAIKSNIKIEEYSTILAGRERRSPTPQGD